MGRDYGKLAKFQPRKTIVMKINDKIRLKESIGFGVIAFQAAIYTSQHHIFPKHF